MSRTSARREVQLAVLLCLAGAAVVLLAAGRPWLAGIVPAAPPLPHRPVRLAGGDVAAVRPLGLLGLAGVLALAATRGVGRLLVGALLLLAGVLVVGLSVRVAGGGGRPTDVPPDATLSPTLWPVVAVAGGVLLALSGLLVALRGRGWAGLSQRYEAPAVRAQTRRPSGERAVWEALDRGEDPTTPEQGDPGPGDRDGGG